MNRQEAKELLPIIQAFSEGKEIEGFPEPYNYRKEWGIK